MSNNKLAAVAGVNENKWYKNCVSNGQKPLRARTHNIQANQNIHKLHSRLFRVSVFLTTYRHQFRNSNTFYNCIVVFGVCLFARFFLFLSFGPFLLLLLLLWIFWVQAFLWPLFVALGVIAFANLFVYPHTHKHTHTWWGHRQTHIVTEMQAIIHTNGRMRIATQSAHEKKNTITKFEGKNKQSTTTTTTTKC